MQLYSNNMSWSFLGQHEEWLNSVNKIIFSISMKARKLLLLSLYRFVQLTIQEGVDHAEQLCLQDLPKELL